MELTPEEKAKVLAQIEEHDRNILALAEKRAARGAAALDEYREGWALQVDTGVLDMAEPEWCTAGQVGKADGLRYGTMLDTLRARDDWHYGDVEFATAHGFDRDIDAGVGYRTLRAAWLKEIAARQVAAVMATVEQQVADDA